jgi:hypothetical protein
MYFVKQFGFFALTCACLTLLACKTRNEGQPAPRDGAGAGSSPSSSPNHEGARPLTAAEIEALARADASDTSDTSSETSSIPQGKPSDYGVFKFPVPPPQPGELTHHAVAGYEVVAIYGEPSMSAEKLGFLRLGQRIAATGRVETQDCPKGWHHLENGGYACASKGLVVDTKPPYMRFAPRPPRLDNPFPYDWVAVRRHETPMWWRFPTDEEYQRTNLIRLNREAKRAESEAAKAAAKSADAAATKGPNGTATSDQWGIDGLGTPAAKAGSTAPATQDGVALTPEEIAAQAVGLPFSPALPWLEKGYVLSADEEIEDGGRRYIHTSRAGYVEAKETAPYKVKDNQGTPISEDMTFPNLGFVMAKDSPVFVLDEAGKLHKKGTFERKEFVSFKSETTIRGEDYAILTDDRIVKKAHVRQPSPTPRPEQLYPWDHWIDVDLSTQILVAYEGDNPVYITLISSGKPGKPEEPFDTPNGTFRIYSKQTSSNMDGSTATDGTYSIQDVPWVMYFHQSYALHGAFWHQSFGYVRSHGCVNLGPTDAHWLFRWTTPYVPSGWHGVNATAQNPGSMVVVRGLPPGRQKELDRRKRSG